MAEPVQQEVRLLLHALAEAVGDTLSDVESGALARVSPRADLARWADSGAMSLTGTPDGPPLAPGPPVASRLAAAGGVLAELSSRCADTVAVDVPALLGERAALRAGGLVRQGNVSAGGGCRLLPAGDGWVALSLNRPDDWELLPAFFRTDVSDWTGVAAAVAVTSVADLSARALDLGIALGVLPSCPQPERNSSRDTPWMITRGTRPTRRSGQLRVVDLSALWAGPLCASLLHASGAQVTTVESANRPDGARRGDPRLHRLLHAGHAVRSVDHSAGLDQLHDLVSEADVVITSARPRALAHLGLDPFTWVDRRPGLTWVAVTAYGLTGPWRNRVGYGDDAAVAGGLVVREPAPVFCADAVADPVTGVYAAIAALAVASAGGGVVDVALRDVAAHVTRSPSGPPAAARQSGDGWVVEVDGADVPVRPPRARAVPAAP